MKILPGSPIRSARPGTGRGELRALLEHAARRALPVRPPRLGPNPLDRVPEQTEMVWHGYLPDVRPGSSTATASTARTSPTTGHRFNPDKLLLDPYAKAGRPAPSTGATSCSATRSAIRRPTCRSTRATTPPAPQWPRSSTRRSPGATTAAATPLAQHGDLRAARQGLHLRHPDVPEQLRGTYSGSAPTPVDRPPARPRRHRRRAAAGAPVRRRPPPGRAGAHQLLGLQHARLLRARRRATPPAAAASRSASSRRWSGRCTRPASR